LRTFSDIQIPLFFVTTARRSALEADRRAFLGCGNRVTTVVTTGFLRQETRNLRDFEDGSSATLHLADPGSSVAVRDKNNAVEYLG
jgi:hypothetical protein